MPGSPPTPVAMNVPDVPGAGAMLTPGALALVSDLHRALDLPHRKIQRRDPAHATLPISCHRASIDDGGAMTREHYLQVRTDALARLDGTANAASRITDADALPDTLVIGDFEEFLTVVG